MCKDEKAQVRTCHCACQDLRQFSEEKVQSPEAETLRRKKLKDIDLTKRVTNGV
jgi:hypothetical protein